MKSVIFHGIKASKDSPRKGREDHDLWIVTRSVSRYWGGALDDWTECFDTHTLEPMGLWPGLRASREQTLDWYALEPSGGRPIWMHRAMPEVPASREFPLQAVMAAHAIDEGHGYEPNRFFGCMVDFLFGKAIMQGYRRVVLNGVGMSTDAGHQYLHRTVLYWIGFCRGRGIQVVVEGDSCYRNSTRQLYAYERYGYAELDALMASYPLTPTPEPGTDLEALAALASSWRTEAKSSPQCAAELDHLLATLQRIARAPEA